MAISNLPEVHNVHTVAGAHYGEMRMKRTADIGVITTYHYTDLSESDTVGGG